MVLSYFSCHSSPFPCLLPRPTPLPCPQTADTHCPWSVWNPWPGKTCCPNTTRVPPLRRPVTVPSMRSDPRRGQVARSVASRMWVSGNGWGQVGTGWGNGLLCLRCSGWIFTREMRRPSRLRGQSVLAFSNYVNICECASVCEYA